MSLHVCLECSTLYAIGLKACPHCGTPTRDAEYDWEDDVVKASEHGASYYVPEGGETHSLPEGVRLVGPGAPAARAEPAAQEAVEGAVQPEPAEGSAAVTEPPKRKPGRPKKVV
jgi:hypothetical protein